MVNMSNDAEIPYIRDRNLRETVLADFGGEFEVVGATSNLAAHSEPIGAERGGKGTIFGERRREARFDSNR